MVGLKPYLQKNIFQIEFPAVTICSPGMNTQILDAILFQKLMDYAEEKHMTLDNIEADHMLTPLELSELSNEVKFKP